MPHPWLIRCPQSGQCASRRVDGDARGLRRRTSTRRCPPPRGADHGMATLRRGRAPLPAHARRRVARLVGTRPQRRVKVFGVAFFPAVGEARVAPARQSCQSRRASFDVRTREEGCASTETPLKAVQREPLILCLVRPGLWTLPGGRSSAAASKNWADWTEKSVVSREAAASRLPGDRTQTSETRVERSE